MLNPVTTCIRRLYGVAPSFGLAAQPLNTCLSIATVASAVDQIVQGNVPKLQTLNGSNKHNDDAGVFGVDRECEWHARRASNAA
jgi:hypothetical protein